MIRRFFSSRSLKFAFVWLLFVLAAALLAPFLLEQRASEMIFGDALLGPSAKSWMGTDALGRDIFSRVLCGARVSLGVGICAVVLSVLVGVVLGSIAAYFRGWVDKVLMGVVDIMLCVPTFFLILAVVAALGPNIFHLMWIIGLTSWMGPARLIRAEILSLKEREFILASRAMGASPLRIVFSHLIPNALGPVIVNAILGLSSAILIETGLSFLGIGVQPPTPSWGNILMDGKSVMGTAWWVTFFPGFFIFLTVFSINLIGEKMSEALRGTRHE